MLRIVNVVKTSSIICGRLRFPKKCLSTSTIQRFPQVYKDILTNVKCPRHYGTAAAAANIHADTSEIENKLQDIDNRIRMTGRIWKADVESVLSSVTERGNLTPMQALLLIRCCGEFLSGESLQARKALCDTVWETIKLIGVTLDISHFNALLMVLIENEIEFSPLEYLLDMKKLGIEPNKITFQRLIEQYCNMGDIEGATKILEHMSEQEIPLNENIFAYLIKGHAKAGDLANATNMLTVMSQAGIEPGVLAYKSVLCAYAMAGDIDNMKMILVQCKNKAIMLNDSEYLEILYYLGINNHWDFIDELMTYMPKGVTYNREAIRIINKLVDKNCLPVAYKLLKSLKPSSYFDEKSDSGQFFIKKLITSQSQIEKIIEYISLMKKEHLNSRAFEFAVEVAYNNNYHHFAVPLMRAGKAHDMTIREHYFYPLFVHYRLTNNLQGLFDTIKTMTSEFNITPTILTVATYVIPGMIDSPRNRVSSLVKNNVPYGIAANAMAINLLTEGKMEQAAKFIINSNTTFYARLLEKSLFRAFLKTKQVDMLVDIMAYQYSKASSPNSKLIKPDLVDNDFQASFLIRFFKEFYGKEDTLLEKILEEMLSRNLPITLKTASDIEAVMGENVSEKINSLLTKLSSGNLGSTKAPKPFAVRGSSSNNFMFRQFKNEKFNIDKFGRVVDKVKLELLLILCERKDGEKIEKLLNELRDDRVWLNTECCESLINYFANADNLAETKNYFQHVKRYHEGFRLKRSSLLNYAILLVKNKLFDEALECLNQPFVQDETPNDNSLCEKLMQSFERDKNPADMEKFLQVLKNRGFYIKASKKMLTPFFKSYFDSNQTSSLVNQFVWACENYEITPFKQVIMKKLIEEEDTRALQLITDYSASIHGESNTLLDLALTFIECDKLVQAKLILQSPNIKLHRGNLIRNAETYSQRGQSTTLKNLVKLLSELNFHNEQLYIHLLDCYSSKGDWESCLSVWVDMQENKLEPSVEFLDRLYMILVFSGQNTIPFEHESSFKILVQNLKEALESNQFVKVEKILKSVPVTQEAYIRAALCKKYLGQGNLDNASFELLNLFRMKTFVSQDLVKSVFAELRKKDEEKNIEILNYAMPEFFRNQNIDSIDV